MNYLELISKGDKYVNDARDNWRLRRYKLILAWAKDEDDYKKQSPRRNRINGIIVELNERIKNVS